MTLFNNWNLPFNFSVLRTSADDPNHFFVFFACFVDVPPSVWGWLHSLVAKFADRGIFQPKLCFFYLNFSKSKLCLFHKLICAPKVPDFSKRYGHKYRQDQTARNGDDQCIRVFDPVIHYPIGHINSCEVGVFSSALLLQGGAPSFLSKPWSSSKEKIA